MIHLRHKCSGKGLRWLAGGGGVPPYNTQNEGIPSTPHLSSASNDILGTSQPRYLVYRIIIASKRFVNRRNQLFFFRTPSRVNIEAVMRQGLTRVKTQGQHQRNTSSGGSETGKFLSHRRRELTNEPPYLHNKQRRTNEAKQNKTRTDRQHRKNSNTETNTNDNNNDGCNMTLPRTTRTRTAKIQLVFFFCLFALTHKR